MLRIKEVVAEKDTTLKEVAAKMGVKASSLSRAVNGNPTLQMLQKIADVLDVHVSSFFVEKEEKRYLIENGELYTFNSLKELKDFVNSKP